MNFPIGVKVSANKIRLNLWKDYSISLESKSPIIDLLILKAETNLLIYDNISCLPCKKFKRNL
jgi:hypothetical protein